MEVTLSIQQFKSGFFDRKAIQEAVGKAKAQNLSKGAAYIRRVAQNSMKTGRGKNADKPSLPGRPPKAHIQGGKKLKRHLYHAWDLTTGTTVIGPAKLEGGEAPRLNEFGGTAKRNKIIRKAGRRASPAQAEAFKRRLASGQIQRAKLPTKVVTARYPQRPFMGPALSVAIAQGKVASVWKDSVKGR